MNSFSLVCFILSEDKDIIVCIVSFIRPNLINKTAKKKKKDLSSWSILLFFLNKHVLAVLTSPLYPPF